MGGRGAYWSGASKDYISREFDSIDTANAGKIKILKKRDGVGNMHFPLYANTSNTTYFVVSEGDSSRIAVIGIYRNHRLIESIDLKDTRGVHWHKWNGTAHKDGKEMRIKERKDYFNLKPTHKRLVEYAKEWEVKK